MQRTESSRSGPQRGDSEGAARRKNSGPLASAGQILRRTRNDVGCPLPARARIPANTPPFLPAGARVLVRPPLCLALLTVALSGCGYFRGAVLLWGQEPTKKVPAEYPYLEGKKACLVVWAEPYTLFEYPYVQLDLAEHGRVALEGAVRGISFVPCRQVVDYQNRSPEWDKEPPARLGARFGAERVLLLELTQYTTREPNSPHLKRGHVAANVKVYDTAAPGADPVYKTTIEATYPSDTPAAYGTDDRSVRRGAMQAFAAQLAAKFCERQEKVK